MVSDLAATLELIARIFAEQRDYTAAEEAIVLDLGHQIGFGRSSKP